MSIKSDILSLLTSRPGEYFSGEEIGRQLYCSRNAVWKAINSLKSEGYEISAVTNKGYALIGGDIFTAESIGRYLKRPITLHMQDSVTSTNDVLKALAEQGEAAPAAVIANRQTKGKGRLGRSFFAPLSGIYISILLRPKFSASQSLMITTAAATAVCTAVSRVCGKECGIKWVNDVFFGGLKICGILTEASIDFETGGLQYAVLGTGINLAQPKGGFPPELVGIAGALYDAVPREGDIKNRLTAEYINAFFDIYESLPDSRYMEEYKKRSIVIGRRVNVIKNGEQIPAKALDIDDSARLLVQYDSGETAALQTGEISIRLTDG